MAKKTTKVSWSFIAVIVAGLAYLVAYVLHAIDANKLAGAVQWIAAICGLIAWIIVFVLGWKRVRENNVWMVIVYIVCMVMIIVFAFLPLLF